MHTVDYSHVVGVFRDRSRAEQAIEKLKRIDIKKDQIQLTEYNLHGAGETGSVSRQESYERFIVNVDAEGKEQEAVGIMVNNGANNADIPPGTKLVHGSLVSSNGEPVDLNPGQSAGENSTGSFFDKNVSDSLMP